MHRRGRSAMRPAALHLALGAALATLGGVMIAEGSGPAHAGEAASCAVSPPADMRTQQQAGAVPVGGGPAQTGPDGRGAPAPSGTIPPQTAATPSASLTLSGSDLSLALPTPCPATSPAATAKGKAHKTRSNIQNN